VAEATLAAASNLPASIIACQRGVTGEGTIQKEQAKESTRLPYKY